MALVTSMVLAYVLCLAPGHQHTLGDWRDPVGTLSGVALVASAIVEVAVLFSMSRRTQ